jgi:hypothetical protein
VYLRGRLPSPTGMSTGHRPEPSYRALLETAHALGRADGCSAARFEPAGPVGPPSPYCQGRDPEQFARHLWADRPGTPPSGLAVNAPLWYATGFAEALAAERERIARRADAAAEATGTPRA